jgi:hypothetical protein
MRKYCHPTRYAMYDIALTNVQTSVPCRSCRNIMDDPRHSSAASEHVHWCCCWIHALVPLLL